MRRTTRTVSILATVVALGAMAAPAAMAKGSSRVDAPADTNNTVVTTVDWCADPSFAALPNQDEILINYLGDVGCFAVRVHNGSFSLANIVLAPGWTYSLAGSDPQRVKLEVTNGATKFSAVVEPGKTRIG